jgi:hypothetical protein
MACGGRGDVLGLAAYIQPGATVQAEASRRGESWPAQWDTTDHMRP